MLLFIYFIHITSWINHSNDPEKCSQKKKEINISVKPIDLLLHSEYEMLALGV